MIDRRSWFAGSLAVLAGAHGVRTQTAGRVFRIGLLGGSAPDSPEARHVWQAFFQTLRERVYEEGRNLRAEALSVLAGSMFFAQRVPIAELALRHRLPSVYLLKEHAEAGGLLTYGIDLRDSFGRAAGYVATILEGAKPGELPIEQPTKFEMVVNLKTARALGLSLPRAVLVRADRVIE